MSDQLHSSLQDLEEAESATELAAAVDLKAKVADLPVPVWLSETTTAKTLGEWLRFESMGEVVVGVTLNCLPVHEGALTPSVYGRRMKSVYAAINAFTGAVANATKHEVILAFNPKLPYVEKARFTKGPRGWVEWNWLGEDGWSESGRRQYGVGERTRAPGLRIPQTVIVELDALSVLIPSGHAVSVGLDNQENFADWLKNIIDSGMTVEQYLKERHDRMVAKNLSKSAWQSASKFPEKGAAQEFVIYNGRRMPIEQAPDGKYFAIMPGDTKIPDNLTKANPTTVGKMLEYARKGGHFTSR